MKSLIQHVIRLYNDIVCAFNESQYRPLPPLPPGVFVPSYIPDNDSKWE